MTPEEIDIWLSDIGKDRRWLAEKLGISLGTLYNGFSKGFSPRSLKAISDIKNQSNSHSGGLEVTFTAREFERIEAARSLLGLPTRKHYYESAITEFTDQILSQEAATTLPHDSSPAPTLPPCPPSATSANSTAPSPTSPPIPPMPANIVQLPPPPVMSTLMHDSLPSSTKPAQTPKPSTTPKQA